MVSEAEQIREELRAIEEVIVIKHNRQDTGDWSNYNELHLKQCVPHQYQFMEKMERDSLERRKERLERDLQAIHD